MDENTLQEKNRHLEREIEELKKNEAGLRRSELELFLILEGVPSFIFLLDKNMQVCRANRATLDFAEQSQDDIFGLSAGRALLCIHHLDKPEGCGFGPFCQDCILLNAVLQTFKIGVGYHRYEVTLPFRADEIPPRTFLLTTTFMSFGEEDLVLVCLEDVSDLKKTEEVLQNEKEKFKSITSAAQDAIIMIDDEGTIRYWNEAAERIFDYPTSEAMGGDIHELLIPPGRKGVILESLAELRDSGKCHVIGKTTELLAMKKDGEEIPIELSLSKVMMEKQWHAVGIVRDITQRKKMELELERMATTDQLTGTYNRRKLLELLVYERKLARRSGRPLGLIMFDIDNFKQINDQYGHSVGDDVLKTLVLVVQRSIREVDVLARWGGEEFVILTPDTDLEGGIHLAEKLRRMVAEVDFPDVGRLTISLGVAADRPGESIDFFMSRVDDCMYKAKRKGKNRVHAELDQAE